MAQMPDAKMLTSAMRQGLPIGPTDGINGEPPCVQNIPICIDTRPLDRDPQAARNGGSARGYPAGFGSLAARLRPSAVGPALYFYAAPSSG